MKIKMLAIDRQSLSEFADAHELTMEIHQRTPSDMGSRWNPNCRFYAHFENCEIKEDGTLVSTFGDGTSPDEAMTAFAKQISRKRLVFNAGRYDRFEVYAPILYHVPECRF